MKSPTDYKKLSARVSGIANSYGNVGEPCTFPVAFGKLHEILLENSILSPSPSPWGWNAVRERGKQSRIPYNFHLETVSRRIDEASETNARLELTILWMTLSLPYSSFSRFMRVTIKNEFSRFFERIIILEEWLFK